MVYNYLNIILGNNTSVYTTGIVSPLTKTPSIWGTVTYYIVDTWGYHANGLADQECGEIGLLSIVSSLNIIRLV